jgi:predicted lysophospholipase L1 biosynthesis ABC-type transport system permease subunit
VRQLDAAGPYLRGALVVGFMILLAIAVHALWTRARASRHDFSVLRVIGCTRRQLDAVTAWQVAPFALVSALVGIPFGIALGRLLYRLFAQSLAVVDDPSTPLAVFAALVLAVCVAAAVADLVAIGVTRRTRAASVLRQG